MFIRLNKIKMRNEKWLFSFKKSVVLLFSLFSICAVTFAAETAKQIYEPASFGAMDLNNESSQWCYQRSKQTDDFIVFWEAGYGSNPNTVSSSSYKVDVDAVLAIAENCFDFYTDSLKFITRGSSKTDKYKMIIRLYYSTTWMASGSGEDNVIGTLNLSANAAQTLGVVVAHEVGHCFQYQVHCDQGVGGWMYGFGTDGAGGNCFWEQCAQWQAYKVYPERQFTESYFNGYYPSVNKHILHETPRYSNFFIQDYWCYLHGMDFIGKLWRQSRYPEDPVDTYLRINGITQSQFNDEIYDCAARFASWDIPTLRSYGAAKVDARPQCAMTLAADNYWLIDSTECLENYGHNIIKLNAPSEATTVTAYFEGKTGTTGFRNLNRTYAGWRYGFVALLKDGSRVYSPMRSPLIDRITNPKDTLSFDCPDNCSRLWLVVSGAPKKTWHHAWDNNDANDEQWPYQVKFDNTNLYGNFNFTSEDTPHNETITYEITQSPFTGSVSSTYPSTAVQVDIAPVCKAFCLQLPDIQKAIGSTIIYNAVNPNGTLNSVSTATAPGHWFSNTGAVTNWGNNSYIFSQLTASTLTFNIGQYPGKCTLGSTYTVRQALVYKPTGTGKTYQVTFVFKVKIAYPTAIEEVSSDNITICPVKETVVTDNLHLTDTFRNVTVRNMSGLVLKQVTNSNEVSLENLSTGLYLVTVDGVTIRIYKK